MFDDRPHPDFPPLAEETVLWRYMDLPKFLSLMEYQALHFTRADLMEDRWEGSASPLNLEAGPSLYGDDYAQIRSSLSRARELMRQQMYLNCWHASEYESAAMWSLYQSSDQGIALRTTWGALKSSLQGPWPIQGGTVNYVDYRTTFIPEGNLYSVFMHKRVSFAHEREVRLVLWSEVDRGPSGSVTLEENPDTPVTLEAGYKVPVELRGLTDAVFVAPRAAGWYAELVQKIIRRYDLPWAVTQSDLAADPVW